MGYGTAFLLLNLMVRFQVIKRIYRDAADMANILGMSYITSYNFDPDAIEDLGLTQADPMKPGSQASRTLRLNNSFNDISAYDVRS